MTYKLVPLRNLNDASSWAAAAQAAATQAETAAAQAIAAATTGSGGNPCLASFFRVGDEVGRFAFSADGMNFDEIGPHFSPSDSTVRDPSLALWNRKFVLAYTRPTTAGGGAFGTITTFGLATSANARDWTELTPINVNVSGAVKVWAPDFFIDGSTLRVIFSVSTSSAGAIGSFKAYEVHTTGTDLSSATWSQPVALPGFPSGIDAHIVSTSGGYAAFYSSGDSNLCLATAASVLGTWTDGGVVDSSWAHAEGPAALPLGDGRIRLFVDSGGFLMNVDSTQTESSQGENEGIFFSDFSADLSTHTPLKHVALPMRHIGIIPLEGNTSPASMKGTSMRSGGTLYITGDGSSYDQTITLSSSSAWAEFTTFNRAHLSGGMRAAGGSLVIPQDGRYSLAGSACGVALGSGWFEISISVNGVALDGCIAGSSPAGDTADVQNSVLPTTVLELRQGDVLKLLYRGTVSKPAPGFRAGRTTLTAVQL